MTKEEIENLDITTTRESEYIISSHKNGEKYPHQQEIVVKAYLVENVEVSIIVEYINLKKLSDYEEFIQNTVKHFSVSKDNELLIDTSSCLTIMFFKGEEFQKVNEIVLGCVDYSFFNKSVNLDYSFTKVEKSSSSFDNQTDMDEIPF